MSISKYQDEPSRPTLRLRFRCRYSLHANARSSLDHHATVQREAETTGAKLREDKLEVRQIACARFTCFRPPA
jgi:hypothetical protein